MAGTKRKTDNDKPFLFLLSVVVVFLYKYFAILFFHKYLIRLFLLLIILNYSLLSLSLSL